MWKIMTVDAVAKEGSSGLIVRWPFTAGCREGSTRLQLCRQIVPQYHKRSREREGEGDTERDRESQRQRQIERARDRERENRKKKKNRIKTE